MNEANVLGGESNTIHLALIIFWEGTGHDFNKTITIS